MEPGATWIEEQPFLMDVEQIHWNAVRELKQSKPLSGRAPRDSIIALLSQVQLLLITMTFRDLYKSRAAARKQSVELSDRLMDHAIQNQVHAEGASAHIAALGGENVWNVTGLPPTSHLSRLEGVSLPDMVQESLLAVSFVIELCRRSLESLEAGDPPARDLLEKILASEERQVAELTSLLDLVKGREKSSSLPAQPSDELGVSSWNALFAARGANQWFRDMMSREPGEE